MKASNHAFLLLALFPIPQFICPEKNLVGVLESRLVHKCLDFILQPLKTAAEIGIMMSDPLGYLRYCFTPLVAYIVDTPESALLAGVAGKTSSVTMASFLQFGDPFRHPPRTASTILAQLQATEFEYDPWNDLGQYVDHVKETYRLNGVHRPFWRNWPLSDPSNFLTPEPLHHWHKGFWDHDVRWCINIVGGPEIDFRFSILQPRTGFRHFREGISKLKQVTGREHRDIERYIIPVIIDAVPRNVLIAIRALMDFRYLAQAPEIDKAMCSKIEDALQEFHTYKASIVIAGGRLGKKRRIINNWWIPKLEFLQNVVPGIRANGAAIQWSADITEHAHIANIKDPVRASNNQEYEAQICRYLDRKEKCRRFDLATAVREAGVNFREFNHQLHDGSSDSSDILGETSRLLRVINPVMHSIGSSRTNMDYFSLAQDLLDGGHPNAPLPFRTFSRLDVAFHLTQDPSFRRLTVDGAVSLFQLPDLRAAIADYLFRAKDQPMIFNIGGRHTTPRDTALPFTHLEVWTHVRIQSKAFHRPHDVLPARTVHAAPACNKWKMGHHDTVIVNTIDGHEWPHSGIRGIFYVFLALY